jgi:hypothetical protein
MISFISYQLSISSGVHFVRSPRFILDVFLDIYFVQSPFRPESKTSGVQDLSWTSIKPLLAVLKLSGVQDLSWTSIYSLLAFLKLFL